MAENKDVRTAERWIYRGLKEETASMQVEALAKEFAAVRAEGVAQGRAEAQVKFLGAEIRQPPAGRIEFIDDPKPMSRRDEFVRTAMVCLAIAQQWEDDRSFGAEAIKLADDVLKAMDKEASDG